MALPDGALERLVCPSSREPLTLDAVGALTSSGRRYSRTAGGVLDLRPQEALQRSVELTVGLGAREALRPLAACPAPAVDWAGFEAPKHLSPELLSHFPRAGEGELALDLGCGELIHEAACRRAGFDYVGVDVDEPASLLADAHALPFAAESFGFVLSIAVLEHLQHPVLAASEVLRVLRPGGVFLGTVAFLEPWHGDSYYHHTPLGTLNTLAAAGLEVEWVSPCVGWSGLEAITTMQGAMPLTGRLVRWTVQSADRAQRRVWRALAGYRAENRATWEAYRAHTSGAIAFRARRPAG